MNSLSFADDLVFFLESQKGLQTFLNKLDNYCFKWQLTVNIKKKTKIMVFQRNNSPFSEFFYKNQPLTVTHEYNFLGNIIDNKGNFKRSIQELSKKGLKVLFALKKYMSNFVNVPADVSCELFDTLITR
jgi:hypothetical protein